MGLRGVGPGVPAPQSTSQQRHAKAQILGPQNQVEGCCLPIMDAKDFFTEPPHPTQGFPEPVGSQAAGPAMMPTAQTFLWFGAPKESGF